MLGYTLIAALGQLGLIVAAGTDPQAQAAYQTTSHPSTLTGNGRVTSLPVDLIQYFNNQGTSFEGKWAGGEAPEDGVKNGQTYAAEYMPSGKWLNGGVEFVFTQNWGEDEVDNIRTHNQVITISEPVQISQLHFVGAGEDLGGETAEQFTLTYDDGETQIVSTEVKNWSGLHWTNKGPIRIPYHYDATGQRDYNVTHLFHMTFSIPSTSNKPKKLVSITLPPPAPLNAMHIFALSLTPARSVPAGEKSGIENNVVVKSIKATRRWEEVEGAQSGRAQVVEVTLLNPNPSSVQSDVQFWVDEDVRISLSGPGIRTVGEARVRRIIPGDEAKLEVLITPTNDHADWSDTVAVIKGQSEELEINRVKVEGSKVVHDWDSWSEDYLELEEHSAPKWFKQAKFGIFIHWGLFSVPAWTDKQKYAEWYNWWLHDEGSEGSTYKHHLEKYGADFLYDDFIQQFNPTGFNASAWVELFADAGAKYFVLTTKHHDGFALFDTKKTSDRSSVKLGPKRDFLKELMEAAKAEQPSLKRGTYFSMPEWFNPLYQKYGKVMWPGGLAHNPFKPNEVEPYTGFLEHKDFIEDIQLPQMKILAEDYGTDIMWCDIGLSNHSTAFASEWYSTTSKQNRQVTMDDRCGIAGDFTTPEMTKLEDVQSYPWETCSGMDPYSFGYNEATLDEDYRNATDIVHNVIDIAAKGGNFLLNVGPNGNGVIVEAMAKPLRGAGKWLKAHAEAIYETDTFPLIPEIVNGGLDIRLTRSTDALYIISLNKPSIPHFDLPATLPVRAGDSVSLLQGGPIQWDLQESRLRIHLDEKDLEKNRQGIAWVFKVTYGDSEVPLENVRWTDEL